MYGAEVINPLLAKVPILWPLKTPENNWILGVFRGYKTGTLSRNGLKFFYFHQARLECKLITLLTVLLRMLITALRGKGKILLGGFFIGWWEPDKRFWLYERFSKLKTTFCKHWTLIKIKISMTCVHKVWS